MKLYNPASCPSVSPGVPRHAGGPGVGHLHHRGPHVAVDDQPLDAVGLQELQELGVGDAHVPGKPGVRHLGAELDAVPQGVPEDARLVKPFGWEGLTRLVSKAGLGPSTAAATRHVAASAAPTATAARAPAAAAQTPSPLLFAHLTAVLSRIQRSGSQTYDRSTPNTFQVHSM
jgi:hypothetical protein